ncbi:hypothetical protein FYK55_27320 [Roseiconus nitratireducens]|uniref:Uncharacterized protein n=1 Tax=Roseiconus nitratireducens TaxID=2605748 RepID=A0A5M6CW46_9BACT|nr:DUF1819 family protein [Roseiconus nitratireducens]KAA5538600.1 hypothetical protein FYK55_27320 [Roseiconus nitratireducens]
MSQVVGIDRKVKRAWLDSALDRLAQNTDEKELRAFLDQNLKDELPGKESRAKALGLVLKVWSSIPREREPLRDRAVALLPNISGQERVWLHFGMTALAYPFFRDTTEVVGRILALQDDFTTAQVQARMVTAWGDRVTAKLAARYLLNTLVDWDVLRSGKKQGHFLLARKMSGSVPELQLWLLESLLAASNSDEIEAQQLLRLPESFPFQLTVGVADLRRHEGFDIHRQGLDMDMVALRKVKLEPIPKPTKKRKEPKKPKKALPPQPSLFDKECDDSEPSNGKPHPDPSLTKGSTRKKKKPSPNKEKRRVEAAIKAEVVNTLSERADRFLQVQGGPFVPDAPFAAPSKECVEQFRDGHYFGCIALTQAVLEAVIRHIWQMKLKKKSGQESTFDKYLAALHKKNIINEEWKSRLEQLWADRNTFHHLRPSVESDLQKLEETALNSLRLLTELEQEFFGFNVQDGTVAPDHPEYWTVKEG